MEHAEMVSRLDTLERNTAEVSQVLSEIKDTLSRLTQDLDRLRTVLNDGI